LICIFKDIVVTKTWPSGLQSRQTTELTHYVVLFSLKTKRYGTINVIPSHHLYTYMVFPN